MRLSVVIPALVLGLMPVVGCGGSEPPANDPNQYANNAGQYGQQPGGQYGQPQQPGQYGQPTSQYPAQQPGQYQQPAPAAPGAPAPAQPGIPGMPGQAASSTGAATPLPMAAMLTPGLQAIAASDAQGMSADGQSFAGQFQEGQTLEQPLNIQAGKCYTIVAMGAGIQQLDIQLVAQQAPLPAVVLAQSNTTGAQASLGGKGQCFRNPLPIGGPGKVVIKATRGAGMAAAQVFVK